jgi:hypothetical protein
MMAKPEDSRHGERKVIGRPPGGRGRGHSGLLREATSGYCQSWQSFGCDALKQDCRYGAGPLPRQGKDRLDGAAAGQYLEAIGNVRTIDSPDGQAPDGFQRLPQLGTGRSAVAQDMARLGRARSDTHPYVRRAIAALSARAVDPGCDGQSGGVGGDMAFARLDRLTGDLFSDPGTFPGFHALAVDDAGPRLDARPLPDCR